MEKKTRQPKSNPPVLKIATDFDEKPEEPIEVMAYLFDRRGKVLASAPLRDGWAELEIESLQGGMRLFFAPLRPDRLEQAVNLTAMERLHAYEPVWKFDPEQEIQRLLPIPKIIWKHWIWRRCRVRGRVVKPVTINQTDVDFPIRDARVHICEVDRLIRILYRLPDSLIIRLREELIRDSLVRQPVPELEAQIVRPIPLPDPPDWYKRVSAVNPKALNARPEISRLAETPDIASETKSLTPLLDQLPVETRLGLTSSSLPIVRQTLADNIKLILPSLCRWPWLHPFLYVSDELKVVTTNPEGRFDTHIWYSILGDHPDLYFWVEYQIEGVWTTVYRPRICSHTYWNYPCGTEVVLRVTDPRVPACDDPADLKDMQVVMMTIGNGISMSEINHSGPALGLLTSGNPMAHTLELRMDLSRSNLIDNNITHYRWSYRRISKGNGDPLDIADTWHPMSRAVYRYYKVEVPDPALPGGYKLIYKPDQMGPDPAFSGDYLFRIQPIQPPEGEWVPLNEHVDLAMAYFDSADLLEPDPDHAGQFLPVAGRYELLFELFKNDGSLVNWSNPTTATVPEPIEMFMSSIPAPFVPPVEMVPDVAGPQHIQMDSAGNMVGFKFVVHVDNNPCEAVIEQAWLGTDPNNPTKAGPCGFIHFPDRNTANFHIEFKARQRYNYATFVFELDKGSSGPVGSGCADWNYTLGKLIEASVGSATVNGYDRNAASGVFSKTMAPALILGTCTEAAFAETLHVYATAENGYSRAYWLDAHATPLAFALSPAKAVVSTPG